MEISSEIETAVAFYDVDSMAITWHGNYVKFLEDARCALLDLIGYNYIAMKESGFVWPVVLLNIKYIKPSKFRQKLKIKATLIDYENTIKVKYLITDAESGMKISKAETMQIAVDMRSGETCYASPKILIDKVERYLRENGHV